MLNIWLVSAHLMHVVSPIGSRTIKSRRFLMTFLLATHFPPKKASFSCVHSLHQTEEFEIFPGTVTPTPVSSSSLADISPSEAWSKRWGSWSVSWVVPSLPSFSLAPGILSPPCLPYSHSDPADPSPSSGPALENESANCLPPLTHMRAHAPHTHIQKNYE